jgi:helicase
MGTRGLFIGINKHRDPSVRELRGAKRDAQALHALFLDALPDMEATLLVDADATCVRIADALRSALLESGLDDVVIVSFAGYGTPSHRLVAHDVDRARELDTTVAMDVLAEMFRKSPARAVLCILDCCFSGDGAARVLDALPAPRAHLGPLGELVGEGRILLAASNVNEPAWETRGTGHGLLTKGLIDVFSEADTPLDIQGAIPRVMSIVRTEAHRIGVAQTPVMVGKVTGGLVMPPRRPGPGYRGAFPERVGVRVSGDMLELAAFGIWQSVIDSWAASFKSGLNELQVKAVNEARVLDGASLLVVAPTSSGKTFIGEMAVARAVSEGHKAVFLVPYRALVSETFDTFSRQYEASGLRVLRCSGDCQDHVTEFVLGRYDLAVLTFEMFLSLIVTRPPTLDAIDLVVLDEAQFITDPDHGIDVELLFALLLRARARGTVPQLVALSAVIDNTNEFDQWLGVTRLVHDKRPVPLTEGVIDRTGVFVFLDAAGKRQETQMLQPHEIVQRRDRPSALDVLVPLAQRLLPRGETLIVFRNKRGPAGGVANYLADSLGLPPASDAIAALSSADPSSATVQLRECLAGGTAFHTTDLSREEKGIIEREFRRRDGRVRVVASTTSLAAGVNTPASTVVLAEQEFVGEDGRPFTVAEYKNMAGRAGRPDFQPEGRAIILADSPLKREQLFTKYVLGMPEPLRSSFDPRDVSTWPLRLLSHVHQVPRNEVVALLTSTYGAYLASRADPEWGARTAGELDHLLGEMLRLNLLDEDGDRVQLTLLGHACGRSSFSFHSCMHLVDVLTHVGTQQLSGETLMALVQLLRESDEGYTPMMRRGTGENVRSEQVSVRYGAHVAQLLQRFAADNWDWLARCKRASILWDWISGVPTETIERDYTPNWFHGQIALGDIVKFADATRYHLLSAHEIASVMMIQGCPDDAELDRLLRRLQVGVPATLVDLLELPVTLSRGAYLALQRRGVSNRAQLACMRESQVAAIIGEDLANALATARCLAARAAVEERPHA